jgi:hypothetical protein
LTKKKALQWEAGGCLTKKKALQWEAGGCLTKKKALQWEAVLSQGEAIFVDWVSLFVTFCYCFYYCKLLFYCSMAGGLARHRL